MIKAFFRSKWLRGYQFLVCFMITLLFMVHTSERFVFSVLQRTENIFYDLRLQLTLPNTIDSRIVIVDIDEKSLAQEGHWPWRRDKLAYLLDMLFDYYNIKLLGFDVLFSEADNSGQDIIKKIAEKYTDKTFNISPILKEFDYDDTFAKSLMNRPIVMGYFTSHLQQENTHVGLLPEPLSANTNNDVFTHWLFKPQSYTANLEKFQLAAKHGGFFNNPNVDDDGVYRRLPLIIFYENKFYGALSLSLFHAFLGFPEIEFNIQTQYDFSGLDHRLESITMAGFTIPMDATGNILVPFRGRQYSFPYVSATDVLNGVADAEVLKDKIIIIGTSAAGLLDLRSTPMQNAYSGVEVHANILSGFLDQSVKSRPTYLIAFELFELLIIFIFSTFIFPRVSVMVSGIVLMISILSIVGLNGYFWTQKNLDTHLAAPLLLLTLLYGVQIFFGFFFETRKKKQLSQIFGQYIPSELVEEMSKSDENFTLQGESRELTVFFSDVRGFTTISEQMEPQELCDLINEILTPVTRIIHESKGTIDKYIGDAIMAFWGAPVYNEKHAFYAIKAALNVVQTLKEINILFKQKNWQPIDMGIGINTGKMNVGNMGSQFRIAYTVMGDAVNLGSRLEGLTKQYGVHVIVSEFTKNAAPEFIYRELDRVRVKGKLEPISIYEPLCEVGQLLPMNLDNLSLLDNALRDYRAQKWDSAEIYFKKLTKHIENDKLCAIYLDRIAHYKNFPPESNWDGVFTYTSK